MANRTIWMLPNVDCLVGVKDEFAIEESPDASCRLFSLVWSLAFKFGDEVLEATIVQYTDKREDLGFYLAIVCVML
jgi:hypothetical protein